MLIYEDFVFSAFISRPTSLQASKRVSVHAYKINVTEISKNFFV